MHVIFIPCILLRNLGQLCGIADKATVWEASIIYEFWFESRWYLFWSSCLLVTWEKHYVMAVCLEPVITWETQMKLLTSAFDLAGK